MDPSLDGVIYQSGLPLVGAVVLVALLASFLALITSTALLWRYRKAVDRLMSAGAGEPQADALNGDIRSALDDATARRAPAARDDRADTLHRFALNEPWRHAYRYGRAGILFAMLLGAAAFWAFSRTEMYDTRASAHPMQFLFIVLMFCWPIVLTIRIVAAPEGRRSALWVGGYFTLVAVCGGLLTLLPTEDAIQVGDLTLPAWSGDTPLRMAGKWCLFNLAPTLLFVAFRHRHVRAIAPLALGFMTFVSAGLLGIATAAIVYRAFTAKVLVFAALDLRMGVIAAYIAFFLLILAAAGVVFGAFGWLFLLWLRGAYRRKVVSDQSLAVDALWLMFASFYAAVMAFAGPGWALAAPIAFIAFKLAVGAGNRGARARAEAVGLVGTTTATTPMNPTTLLVLRVFSLGKRSQSLFDAVTRHWRYVGDVRLIAGTDLALATVAPHQVMAFLSGGLGRLFIRSRLAIEERVAEVDDSRDADGRFRINDFFCHADTWQRLLTRIVTRSDVVLMDLRAFAPSNAGCVYEIKSLLEMVPVGRLVFVVDDTTNRDFLAQILAEAVDSLGADSPNRGLPMAGFQLLELRALRQKEIGNLLRRLCLAATQDGLPEAPRGSAATCDRVDGLSFAPLPGRGQVGSIESKA